jgi:hypothetical protein
MHAQFGGKLAHQIGIAGFGIGRIVRIVDQPQSKGLGIALAGF